MKTTINQRIVIQILIWTLLFVGLPLIISSGQLPEFQFYRSLEMTISAWLILIINLKWLFPRFYQGDNFLKYIAITLVLIIVIRGIVVALVELSGIGMMAELEQELQKRSATFLSLQQLKFIILFMSTFPMMLVTFASTLFEAFIWVNQSAKESAQLKSEKLEAELKFLKSQINPHFLFNSLNNIYTLTVLDPPKAGNNLLKLSEMLRYLLYECDAEKVTLGRELAYLRNYIDLFMLKDDEALNINFDTKDVNEDVMIAPLLFIPFVENAFKHSQIEDTENGWINISLLGDEEQVYFEIKNSVPSIEFSKDEVGGIGLQNVKRQLELIYPNKHQLNIELQEEVFSVGLTLFI